MEFTVIQGDIAAQQADALVNAAGTSLQMGSGVAGALRRAAGSELNDAAVAQGPVELGNVAVTGAFDLDAQYVIHVDTSRKPRPLGRGGNASTPSPDPPAVAARLPNG